MLERAGVSISPVRIAQVYLELAVMLRALEGLSATVRIGSEIDRSALWAGLFDLRENLLGRAVDDLRRDCRRARPGMSLRRRSAMGGARQGRRERAYWSIRVRPRTPHRVVQRGSAAQGSFWDGL